VRVTRDWFSEPRLVTACEQVGVIAAAGWMVILARGCLSQGQFPDFDAVVSNIRSLDIGLSTQDAERVADALIVAGLLTQDGDTYTITDWANFTPPRNALAPSQRTADAGVTPITPRSRASVTEGVTKGVTKGVEGGTAETPTTPPTIPLTTIIDDYGNEAVVRPPRPQPTSEGCSHGHAWVLQPAGSKGGKEWQPFWSGDHRLPEGAWCRERRPSDGL
jgi:hypothetical protein